MTDERGVSTVVGFVLTLGITSLLIIGLLVGTTGFVDGQRQETIRDELQVLGQQAAADIAAADRLERTGSTSIRVERQLPSTVTGLAYQISVSSTSVQGGYRTNITLQTTDPEIVVSIYVQTVNEVTEAGALNGGDVVIEYTGGVLEVRNV